MGRGRPTCPRGAHARLQRRSPRAGPGHGVIRAAPLDEYCNSMVLSPPSAAGAEGDERSRPAAFQAKAPGFAASRAAGEDPRPMAAERLLQGFFPRGLGESFPSFL